jgi:hypothetical protein
MKKFLRVAVFILAFQMEVRVRASADLMQEPQGCLSTKETSCFIKAATQSGGLKLKKGAVYLKQSSIVERKSQQTWTFVQGTAWFHSGGGTVRSLYGDLSWTEGDFWIKEEENRILIRNVSADLTLELRDGRKLQPPSGFEFWLAGVDFDSKSKFGMIRPIEVAGFIKDWAELYPGTPKEFKKEVESLKQDWESLPEISSAIYQDEANRQIATAEAKEEAEKSRQKALQDERERMKALFYHRTFNR